MLQMKSSSTLFIWSVWKHITECCIFILFLYDNVYYIGNKASCHQREDIPTEAGFIYYNTLD